MHINVLDALSPLGAAREALTTPAGIAVLTVLILLLLAAILLIVKKVRKKNAALLPFPAEVQEEQEAKEEPKNDDAPDA